MALEADIENETSNHRLIMVEGSDGPNTPDVRIMSATIDKVSQYFTHGKELFIVDVLTGLGEDNAQRHESLYFSPATWIRIRRELGDPIFQKGVFMPESKLVGKQVLLYFDSNKPYAMQAPEQEE